MGVDDRVRSIVQALGLKLVLWNVDTFDWQCGGLSPENQISRITKTISDCITGCSTKNPNRGGIILEHDFPSALAIPSVLDLMMSTSLNLKTASHCAGYDAYNGDWLSRIMSRVLPPGPSITTTVSTRTWTSRITAITSTTGITSAISSDHFDNNSVDNASANDSYVSNASANDSSLNNASANDSSLNNASAETSGIWTFLLIMLTIFFYI
jgi:hypothetical protein